MAQSSRLLRTEEEIRAAGTALGQSMPPLSERQVDELAAILAPLTDARHAQPNPTAGVA
jgi:hypothetical protein